MNATAAAAGWFEDPHGGDQLRWWDGSQWTEHVAPHPEPAVEAAPVVEAVPVAVADAAPVVEAAPLAEAAPVAHPALAVAALPSVAAVPEAPPALPPAASSSSSSSSRRDRAQLTPRTLMAAGAVALVAVLAVTFMLLGGGEQGAGGAAAAAATPLSVPEYQAKMQSIGEDESIKALESDDPTPAQLTQAATDLRAAVAAGREVTPPVAVATQHATLMTQMEQVATGIDALAANPKDQAAALNMLSSIMAAAATMQTIEKTLGIKLEAPEQGAATAPAAG